MTFLRDSLLAVLAISLAAILFAPVALALNGLWGSGLPIGLKLIIELLVLTIGSVALLPLHLYAEYRREAGRPIGETVVDVFRDATWPWPVLLALTLGPSCGLVGWAFREHPAVWVQGLGLAMFFLGWLSPLIALFLWRDTRTSSHRPRGDTDL